MSSFSLLFLIFILIPWTVALAAAEPFAAASISEPIAMPGCRESCENSTVKIPFPFGIGPDCYYDSWYEITCHSSSLSSSKPFLSKFNLEVLSISSCLSTAPDHCGLGMLYLEVPSYWQTIFPSRGVSNSSEQEAVTSIDFQGSPFEFSCYNNVFVMDGCPGHIVIMNRSSNILGRCLTTCPTTNPEVVGSNGTAAAATTCDGVGCCFAYVNQDLDLFQVNVTEADSSIKVALMKRSSQQKIVELSKSTNSSFPTVIYWKPPPLPDFKNLVNMSRNKVSCSTVCDVNCQSDYRCADICWCSDGLPGNPYIPGGCQGLGRGGVRRVASCISLYKVFLIGWMGSVIVLLFCCYVFYLMIKRLRQIKQRANFFERNGGFLLQQQMTSTEGAVKRTKAFTADELEKATNNFKANRILGQGGQGTVFKGMLPDGRLVAIKKSKKVDESQLQHFTNEVAILSQINHRNVVQLLGCCLETEVPLLVYEYVPNGPLSEHIHNPSEDFHITWTMRLQIALESAWAIAYLHSSSAIPIYHRDIKSSNILLDEKYRAKVSDFGASRTLTIENTHLTTCVHGTFGYLDPEYFQSNQFTDKSDVYSFGVVLVELLTSRKPLTPTQPGGCKSLAIEFLLHMETSRLHDILDPRVKEEAEEEELAAVANLALRCLNLHGKLRPTMKQVAIALEDITRSLDPEQHHSNNGDDSPDGVSEMSYASSGYLTSATFISKKGVGASCSVEIQPFMHSV